ncbi:hypothetical protein BGZ61DRAFT_484443 [Ilyonectria robusta]|uniref:uncharacterized protein n=1 Tax=Ilyonectria robusta TaxID=1079257 RepID=UPI001E8CAE55|nr:uncharacterized protein BGZ61DRAFT_484443 [Ilyonectria robusta]KAH8665351.1 hypothetical protein BGZ61DRAFT_484443 [Ilyonectria robusta]
MPDLIISKSTVTGPFDFATTQHLADGALNQASQAFGEAHEIQNDPLENTKAELATTLWYWIWQRTNWHNMRKVPKLERRAICTKNSLPNQQRPVDDHWANEEFDNLVVLKSVMKHKIRSMLLSKASRASASAGSLKYWTRSGTDIRFLCRLSRIELVVVRSVAYCNAAGLVGSGGLTTVLVVGMMTSIV